MSRTIREYNIVCKPIASLPEHVFADSSHLTLFADFEHRSNGDVPIYVVNRSGKPITLSLYTMGVHSFYTKECITFGSQIINLKLEYEETPGQWTRAESHVFRWCGYNDDKMILLDADSYLMVFGLLSKEGIKVRVRYSFYLQDVRASSNSGEAFINKKEVERAANDALAVYSGNFEFVKKVALGEITLKDEMDHRNNDLRIDAIWHLARGVFDQAEAEKVLERIAQGADKKYAPNAKEALEILRKQR